MPHEITMGRDAGNITKLALSANRRIAWALRLFRALSTPTTKSPKVKALVRLGFDTHEIVFIFTRLSYKRANRDFHRLFLDSSQI